MQVSIRAICNSSYLTLLLGFFLGTVSSLKGACLAGEHWSSARLPISFLLSLIGDKGVLRREPPLLGKIRSESPPAAAEGLMGDVGEEDGDLGEPAAAQIGRATGGGKPGEVGELGDWAPCRHSSLGVRSILILGGPVSADLDRW